MNLDTKPKSGIKGKISTSSTSKTRKITAIRKNRIENGIRGNLLGLNPHSKGLSFSRSRKDFFLRPKPKLNNRYEINKTSVRLSRIIINVRMKVDYTPVTSNPSMTNRMINKYLLIRIEDDILTA